MKTLLAELVAELLWQCDALRISPDSPFQLASGNYSPMYVDCRRIISDSVAVDLISAAIHFTCANNALAFNLVAGGETAGIPFAAFAAARLNKPMVYVRKATKNHGLGALVEGGVVNASEVLLIEDLVTDGRSKLAFIEALRSAGAIVTDCLVVFDRQQGAADVLIEHGVTLAPLTTLEVALSVGVRLGKLSPAQLREVTDYTSQPELWHQTRNLPYRPQT